MTDPLAARWRGQRHRLEVFYLTLSDPGTGVGAWVHHELVAPAEGEAHVHGFTAVFRPPAPPVLERFGPKQVHGADSSSWPTLGSAIFAPPALTGAAGRLEWDLRWDDHHNHETLYTFPRSAWERELLPGAQIVPVPSATVTGTVVVDGATVALSPAARGGVAHIYGHGNAARWAWLHADLGQGDVLEVVSAVSRQPGLDRLPPLSFVQLRRDGKDWPRQPLVAAPLLKARIELPSWGLKGTVGRRRLRVEVDMPMAQSVAVGYVDPDGERATCTNSEVSDAEIVLEHRRARWETEASWSLPGTAHAEVGMRP